METLTQNTYKMPELSEVPTPEGYFEEELNVRLTRREVWWLRDMLRRKIASAVQSLNDKHSHPQKRRARYEEWQFLTGINDRLHGSDPDCDERRAEFRKELHKQAEDFEARAREIRELAGTLK